jgi:hypothetical protein
MFHRRLRLALIAFTALWLLSVGGAHAGEWFQDGRIGAGIDLIHERGTPMVSAALYPASLMAWNDNFGIGLTYPIGPRVGWNAGLGGILVRREDGNVGTRLNFLLRLSYCGEKLCLSFAHISHGSGIGIRDDAANSGLNFLFLEYRYR